MSRFSYRARNRSGEAINGEMEAKSIDAVASQLLQSGSTPIEIKPAEAAATVNPLTAFLDRLRQSPPTLDDLILFCRQMYTLSKAGVPLIRGLVGLAETTQNEYLVKVLRTIRRDLEAGRDLASCMAQHRNIFTNLMISMVQVGEHTGKLDESFLQLAEYLEQERQIKEQITSALRYPSFVIIAIAIAIGITNIFVIPAFAGVFNSMKMNLPWQTQALIASSDFFVAYWHYIVVVIVVAFFWVRYYINTEEGRYRWDGKKLTLPLVGSIILRATLSRFARSFAMASRAGVPLIHTLAVVSQAVDNSYVQAKVTSMRNGIERGDSVTRTATATGLFTPLVIQMLSVGEETGAVDDMLDEVANFYEREVNYEVKNLTSAIEPILIVSVGALVLILALGIFLPMWEMTSMASQ
ncbi:MAG: type II secretion system F family protein [Gammaproteobacteria bacterium]|nr:type II secretion system F family protein [Gammaproteobacteria bacterium]